MITQFYQDNIMEHCRNPRNYGNLANPDSSVTEYNPLCGDKILLSIKVTDQRISEIAFTSDSCAVAKSISSIFFDSIKGKDLKEIAETDKDSFLLNLPTMLPSGRSQCALLPYTAIIKAIKEYPYEKSR